MEFYIDCVLFLNGCVFVDDSSFNCVTTVFSSYRQRPNNHNRLYLAKGKPDEREIWARFLSLARSKLRLCSANHRPGYWSNLPCDWLSIVWAYSEQETENRPWLRTGWPHYDSVISNETNLISRMIYTLHKSIVIQINVSLCILSHVCFLMHHSKDDIT